jgi:putative ABC transport system ATP-binding protein
MSRQLLEFESVSKVYRMGGADLTALKAVDLSIDQGEMVAIVGTSGSGKSTALNILGTLDRPTEGVYRIGGVPVQDRSEEELAELRCERFGFVFQSFNLLARETAVRNVELPMVYRGIAPKERRRRAEHALERVGLADRMHHLPKELSGGQQQRVAIARALVNEPSVILADEPTGALDSATTRQVLELLSALHAEGKTLLIVTHDPAVAAYAGRVVLFRDGIIASDERRPSNVEEVAA